MAEDELVFCWKPVKGTGVVVVVVVVVAVVVVVVSVVGCVVATFWEGGGESNRQGEWRQFEDGE